MAMSVYYHNNNDFAFEFMLLEKDSFTFRTSSKLIWVSRRLFIYNFF